MLEFVAAAVTALLIAIVASVVFERFQVGSDIANTTEIDRVHWQSSSMADEMTTAQVVLRVGKQGQL